MGATDEEIANFFQTRDERKDPKRQQNLQLADSVMLKLEIDADAPPGPHFLRLVTPVGVSSPIAFCVGDLPEFSAPAGKKGDAPPAVELPAVLNGRILPGETRSYSFDLKRGQRIVVAVQARDLIPYLADAVPGWFEPDAVITNSTGETVAMTAGFRTGPDPVFCFEVPETGTYYLKIRDALYRGREDFVYRVSVGEIPFVTGIFPLGGQVGSSPAIGARGWNLPSGQSVTAPTAASGIHPVPGLSNGFATGDVAFAVDDLPEVFESEPNGTRTEAMRVGLPVTINGVIDPPGDTDIFAFDCQAGQKVVAEVLARRLNSPLDSWLKITGSEGRQLAFNDDFEDREAGLLTDQADSRVEFTAAKAGTYFVEVGDTRKNGGADFAYRLRLGGPRPDFAVRVVPPSINGKAGAVVPVTLYALRRDGFQEDIDVVLKDPPEGFLLQGGRIPGGADSVRATLNLPPAPTAAPVKLVMESRSTIGGKPAVRPAVAAEDMLQAFIYRQLVPAGDLFAAVTGTKTGSVPITVSGPAMIPVGGSGKIVVSQRGQPAFNIKDTRLELRDPPDGVTLEGFAPCEGGIAITFRCTDKVKPGTRGTLMVETFGEKTAPSKDGAKPVTNRWTRGYLPAIEFEIVRPAG